MRALQLVAAWDVANAAAAVVADGRAVGTIGDLDRVFRLASLTKVATGWAAMVAVEEGTIGLDDPVGQPGCTLRHLLAHAGGYPTNGAEPITKPPAAADLLQLRHRARRRGDRAARRHALRHLPHRRRARPAGHDEHRAGGLAGERAARHGIRSHRLARRAAASPVAVCRWRCGIGHNPVRRAERYRSRRGEVRSVPMGFGRRDPWREVAALDGRVKFVVRRSATSEPPDR